MAKIAISHCLSLLCVVVCHALCVEESQVAFIQTGHELHYFATPQQLAESNSPYIIDSGLERSANNADANVGRTKAASASQTATQHSLNQLIFEPAELEFNVQAIGIPHLRKVTVRNPTASSVRFDAISGSTVHFHCSFFEHKDIGSGEATTFDVVFLPRVLGRISNTLNVHSSLGPTSYMVMGTGAGNPYRLRPVVGARIPVNSTLVSPLELHNPYSSTLRVTQMYSTGGDLHLELPSDPGLQESAGDSWEIPPYSTKTVMQARFVGARERNTTAYIRIEANLDAHSPLPDQEGHSHIKQHQCDNPIDGSVPPDKCSLELRSIVVPFEVEVTKKKGLYAVTPHLDFGVIRNGEPSKQLQLMIVSNMNKSIEITSIEVDPPLDAISIEFQPLVLDGKCASCAVAVAKLRFMGDRAQMNDETSSIDNKVLTTQQNTDPANGGDSPSVAVIDDGNRVRVFSGRIVLSSKFNKHTVYVPYTSQVFQGKLLHDTQETAMYLGRAPMIVRNVTLRNTFAYPLAVYNVSLAKKASRYFSLGNVSEPVVIQPGEARAAFQLVYDKAPSAPMSSFARLHTNLSMFDLPVHVFSGKLQITLYSIDQTAFDFGIMDAGDQRSLLFAVTNTNPVPVPLRQFRHAMESYTSLRLLGVEEGNQTLLSDSQSVLDRSHFEWIPGQDCVIPANSFAVFEYSLVAPVERASYHAVQVFQTPYEIRQFAVSFETAAGAVVSIPEKILFSDAFPGKISSQALQVYSTFPRPMPLLRLSTLSHDPRIFFETFDTDQPAPIVKYRQMSYLGRAFFLPIATCMDDCYVGMSLQTNEGAGGWFVHGMRLPSNLAEIDAFLYQRLRSKWMAIPHTVNSTIVVDTTAVKHWRIQAQAKLVWPKLMRRSVVQFPLTAVGNFTIVNLTLTNPSSLPIVVQLLPLTIYPDPYNLLHFFRDELPAPLLGTVETNETLMFTLRDTELFTLREDSPVPRLREQLEAAIGMEQIPRFTLSMILQPGMKVRVRVGFMPKDYQMRTCLLLVRNNLTVLEPVVLYGRGATVQMRVDNRLPRSSQPLMFEWQDTTLKECHNKRRLTRVRESTQFTNRRNFVVKNTGEVPIHVTNMSIERVPCEDRGYRILNCQPFRLRPNESHIIEIAFTADFSLAVNEANLFLYMQGNSSAWIYPMVATLPAEWLARCQHSLPRPHWETLLYYTLVTALTFSLVCLIATAYLEGDRTATSALRQQMHEFRPFDLNEPSSAWAHHSQPIAPASSQQAQNNRDEQELSVWEAIPRVAVCAGTWIMHSRLVHTLIKWTNQRTQQHVVQQPQTQSAQAQCKTVRSNTSSSSHDALGRKHSDASSSVSSTNNNNNNNGKHINKQLLGENGQANMNLIPIERKASRGSKKQRGQNEYGQEYDNGYKQSGNGTGNNELTDEQLAEWEVVERAKRVKEKDSAGSLQALLQQAAKRRPKQQRHASARTDDSGTESTRSGQYANLVLRRRKGNQNTHKLKQGDRDRDRDRQKVNSEHNRNGVSAETGTGMMGAPTLSPSTILARNMDKSSMFGRIGQLIQRPPPKWPHGDSKEADSQSAMEPAQTRTSGSSDESDESSAPPEWGDVPVPSDEADYDEAFDALAHESLSFANVVRSSKLAPSSNTGSDTGRDTQTGHTRTNHSLNTHGHAHRRQTHNHNTCRSRSVSSLSSHSSSPPPVPSANTTDAVQSSASSAHKRRGNTNLMYQGGSSSDSLMLSDMKHAHPPTQSQSQTRRRTDGKHRQRHRHNQAQEGASSSRHQREPATGSAPSRPSTGGVSLMQTLLAERHRRLKEYYQENPEPDWPTGFSLATVTESLWDEEHEPWKVHAPTTDSADWVRSPGVIGQSRSYLSELRAGSAVSEGSQSEHNTSAPGSPILNRQQRQPKKSISPDSDQMLRPEFKFNPQAQPFVSSKRCTSPVIPPDPDPPAFVAKNKKSHGQTVKASKEVTPDVPLAPLPGWPAPQTQTMPQIDGENALGWSGSLFPTFSIWDQSTSANRDSWVDAGFGPMPQSQSLHQQQQMLMQAVATNEKKENERKTKSRSKSGKRKKK